PNPPTTITPPHISEKFSSRFSCSPKGSCWVTISQLLRECAEVSSFKSWGQAETGTASQNIRQACKLLRTNRKSSVSICTSLAVERTYCAEPTRESKGARRSAPRVQDETKFYKRQGPA